MLRFLLAASAVVAATVTLSQSTLAAPSLSCDAPQGRVERKICRHNDLVQMHSTMIRAYVNTERRIRPRSDVVGLVTDQARWVSRRNSCWTKRCLVAAYTQRTETLRSWAVIRDD